MKYRWERRLLRLAVVITVIMPVYSFIVLPGLLHWGATGEEYRKTLPGDELITDRQYKNTLAVTVHAPPSHIWPWVAQMGLHKGGFYSYTFLENLFGCRLKNADHIHPEWQFPKVGDTEPVCASQEGKRGAGWQLAIVQKEKALVWKGVSRAEWMMGVYIDSVDNHTSRLLTWQQFPYPEKWSMGWWLEKLWFEWAHCIMQRGMIHGIKTRVEKNAGHNNDL